MNIRSWLRSLEPKAMAMLDGPMGARIRPWVDQHDVLNFGRHSLAKGLAFGLLCGLLPLGPIQMAATVLMCVRWRGNALIGIVTTLYSNALTIVPLYMLAFQLGQWLVPGQHTMPNIEEVSQNPSWLVGVWDWLSAMGWPLIVGIPVLGVLLAVVGYLLVQFFWLLPIYQRAFRMRKHS